MRRWTRLENAAMLDGYPTYGSKWPGWKKVLPGRTRAQILEHARELGISYESEPRKRWTREDEDKVIELYPLHGQVWPGWRDVLPGRTPTAIAARAAKLGVAKVTSGWTDEQARVVARHALEMARETGKPATTCLRMGLTLINAKRARERREASRGRA